jgi:ribokinase
MFIVLGTTTVDLFVSGIDQMPRMDGDEYTVSSLAWCSQPLTITCGGNGANSAYVLATLGASVGLVSAAGNDMLGDMIVGWLAARGVDVRGVRRDGGYATSTNTTLLDERLNRLNFYHPGGLTVLNYDDTSVRLLDKMTTLLISSYPIMRGFRPAGYAALLAAAHAQSARTAVDIGPAIGEPVTVAELTPLLPLIDYLIANEYELRMCTDCADEARAAGRLIAAGARHVLVKRGKDGAIVYTAGGETVFAPAVPLEATVTVGAGDTFNSGFLFALQEGQPLADALRFAHVVASCVVATGKSVLGCPSLDEVRGYL